MINGKTAHKHEPAHNNASETPSLPILRCVNNRISSPLSICPSSRKTHYVCCEGTSSTRSQKTRRETHTHKKQRMNSNIHLRYSEREFTASKQDREIQREVEARWSFTCKPSTTRIKIQIQISLFFSTANVYSVAKNADGSLSSSAGFSPPQHKYLPPSCKSSNFFILIFPPSLYIFLTAPVGSFTILVTLSYN